MKSIIFFYFLFFKKRSWGIIEQLRTAHTQSVRCATLWRAHTWDCCGKSRWRMRPPSPAPGFRVSLLSCTPFLAPANTELLPSLCASLHLLEFYIDKISMCPCLSGSFTRHSYSEVCPHCCGFALSVPSLSGSRVEGRPFTCFPFICWWPRQHLSAAARKAALYICVWHIPAPLFSRY